MIVNSFARSLDAINLTSEEVCRRFDEAVRNGTPRWLWPNLTIDEWQDAMRSLERVIRGVLLHGWAEHRLEGNAEAIGIACYTSGMGPLLGFWLQQGLITAQAEVAGLLEIHLRHNAARTTTLGEQALRVTAGLAREGVVPTILKGMHTAFDYFPDPSCRPMSDIDVLIAPEDEHRAREVLLAMGLEPGITARWPPQCIWRQAGARAEPHSLCFVHADDPWAIDLQLSLSRRYSAGAPVIRLDQVRGSDEVWCLSPNARVLGPMLTMHLACHASCGFVNLTLLRLVELVLVIRKGTETGRLRWEELVDAGSRAGTLASAWPALSLCDALAPGTVPLWVQETCARAAPQAVRRVVGRFTPATVHRVRRCSIEERYMWTSPIRAMSQIYEDLFPPQALSLAQLVRVYRQRAWRLCKGSVTRY